MLKHIIKQVFRTIIHHKTFSLINISGLALGLACSTLIFLWVENEISYDRFHENADNLYAVTFSNGSVSTPSALSGYLKDAVPEIRQSARCTFDGEFVLKRGEIKANQNGGCFVDAEFFQMFTLPFLQGDPETALKNPNSIVISESLAHFYFGSDEALGKTIEWNGDQELLVTGIMRDYPENSVFDFRYLLPLTLASEKIFNLNSWDVNVLQTFVLLRKGIRLPELNHRLSDVVERHVPTDKRSLFLQPVTKLHLYDLPDGGGAIRTVYAFSLIAVLILLIAWINFMNLTTARAVNRAREVGIRKAIGAHKADLRRQYLTEAFVFTLLAMVMALFLIYLALPLFNSLTGKKLAMNALLTVPTMLGMIVILLVTALCSGGYPAFYLARFRPVFVLKGRNGTGGSGMLLRRILVVGQFTISVFLMISAMVMLDQIRFMKNRELGIEKDHVVFFRVGEKCIDRMDQFKQELLKNSEISGVTSTNCPPYYWNTNAGLGSVNWQDQEYQQTRLVMTAVDPDYLATFGLSMAEGRFFSRDFASDAKDAYVINQAAVKAMEMKDPVGKKLTIYGRTGTIVGVVKDYHYESLHRRILPMAMQINPGMVSVICVRMQPQNMQRTIAYIEQKYREIEPEQVFSFRFLDEAIKSRYSSEEGIAGLFETFTLLAVFISCLGLFGLAAYTTEQRRKEIGLRKVLGASLGGLLMLLSSDFMKWVLAGNLIAWPAAWFFSERWLNGFAYRIDFPGWILPLAAVISVMAAMATVGAQTVKTAMTDPVASLKCE